MGVNNFLIKYRIIINILLIINEGQITEFSIKKTRVKLIHIKCESQNMNFSIKYEGQTNTYNKISLNYTKNHLIHSI